MSTMKKLLGDKRYTGKVGADYPEDMIVDTMGDPWVFMSMALIRYIKISYMTTNHSAVSLKSLNK